MVLVTSIHASVYVVISTMGIDGEMISNVRAGVTVHNMVTCGMTGPITLEDQT